MRVLVITPFYSPDLGPSAALYEMLCEDLARLGCKVSVISAVPHYPTGIVPTEFRGRLVRRQQRNGVDVTRVWVPSVNRARLGLRLFGFLCYQVLAAAVGLRRDYDVLIASNPALEVMLPFLVLGSLHRRPIIYSVHEIYPDIGIKLGIFRHRLIIRSVAWMERFCCRSAAYVRVLSEGYKKTLEAKGVPSSKLAVICDWIDTDFIRPLPRHNAFSTQWGLDGSFVVLYAGNLGPTQGLEQALEAAWLLAAESSIRFVFVGDGAAKVVLQQKVKRRGLANVQFIPFQARQYLPLILASADVSLLMLRRGLAVSSVPSKLYSILASGRPVIASVDRAGDTWKLIQQAGCGLCVEPDDPQALAGAILDLHRYETCRSHFGANSRACAVGRHSRARSAREFYDLLCCLRDTETVPLEETTIHG